VVHLSSILDSHGAVDRCQRDSPHQNRREVSRNQQISKRSSRPGSPMSPGVYRVINRQSGTRAHRVRAHPKDDPSRPPGRSEPGDSARTVRMSRNTSPAGARCLP